MLNFKMDFIVIKGSSIVVWGSLHQLTYSTKIFLTILQELSSLQKRGFKTGTNQRSTVCIKYSLF